MQSMSLPVAARRTLLAALAAVAGLAWAPATQAAPPARGGAANLAMIAEPQALDPMVTTADLVGTIMQHVYEPLYTCLLYTSPSPRVHRCACPARVNP